MKRRHSPWFVLIATMLCLLSGSARGATVWTGPAITFSKASNTDPTVPTNQDHLTALVALTRGTSAGMFNIAQESAFASTSPKGTLWATSVNNPTQTITATNFAALTFDTWQNAYGGAGSLNSNITTHDAVVRLVADDIYLNLRFVSFASGSDNGAFSYQRSTPVPEPATGILATIAAMFATVIRKRRATILGNPL
jgi:hypothetical protein